MIRDFSMKKKEELYRNLEVIDNKEWKPFMIWCGGRKRVTEEGVVEGETSDALKSFWEYAEKLNQVISVTSAEVRDSVMNYLEEIDTQDQYLY